MIEILKKVLKKDIDQIEKWLNTFIDRKSSDLEIVIPSNYFNPASFLLDVTVDIKSNLHKLGDASVELLKTELTCFYEDENYNYYKLSNILLLIR